MSRFALGYGTYGLKRDNIFEVVPKLASLGYRAIELTIADGWPTKPALFAKESRTLLSNQLRDLGFRPPVLMHLLAPFVPEMTAKILEEQIDAACQLACDLNFEPQTNPILTTTLGSRIPDWETARNRIADKVASMVSVCARHGVILALEPHVGCNFDRPEKALWLVQEIDHPTLRLNLDISHFLAMGLDIIKTMDKLLPYTVYAHVKDVRRASETAPVFLLPGQGTFDFASYFRKLREMNYSGSVVVEVSGQIWNLPDYQPWEAAEFSLRSLQKAIEQSN